MVCEIRKCEVLASAICGLNPCFNGIWSARVKSVKICVWALYDQKDRRNRKFWGKTCTSECKYTKVFWIDCTTCHLCLTILGFSGHLCPCQGVMRSSLSGECDTLAGSLILKGTLVSRGLRHFVPRHVAIYANHQTFGVEILCGLILLSYFEVVVGII